MRSILNGLLFVALVYCVFCTSLWVCAPASKTCDGPVGFFSEPLKVCETLIK